jgi:hypothetical protein
MLGDTHEPWRFANSDFEFYTNRELYIFAIYWILTVITTVGYGDYTGGTMIEYIIIVFLEFTGLIVFSVLMILIENVADSNYNFSKYADDKIHLMELAISNVEKCNMPMHINPILFHTITESLRDSIKFDYNTLIEGHTFF